MAEKQVDGQKKKGLGCLVALAVLMLLGIVGALMEGGDSTPNGAELAKSRYGTYRETVNGYESKIIIEDASRIRAEIRSPLGYTDKSGTYTVKDSTLTVTWTTFGDTNLGPKPDGPVTQQMSIGTGGYQSTSWHFVKVGETEYLKKL